MNYIVRFCNLIFRTRWHAVKAALAIAILLALTVVATQSAQAQTFSVIHNFGFGSEGAYPNAGLTMDGAGNFYGTTTSVAGVGPGAVYKLQRTGASWVAYPIYSFEGASDGDGDTPTARVIFGPNGTLYGTTSQGGTGGYGTVFNLRAGPSICRLGRCGWNETVLHSFSGGADGSFLGVGDLVSDRAGNLYGTTEAGGGCDYPGGCGVVYKLTHSGSGWTESIIHSFSGPDGQRPIGGVIFDSAGNLYGTTYGGGGGWGTVFELTPSGSGWTHSILYSFPLGDGPPISTLILDQSGSLYGTTNNGGPGGGGRVFELTPSGDDWTYSVLYSFTGGWEGGPWGALTMDEAGNLYGTTCDDGAYNAGNVFKLTRSGSGWTYTSLHDFTGGSDGAQPFGTLVLDANGNLYGTTYRGGSVGVGVIFQITSVSEGDRHLSTGQRQTPAPTAATPPRQNQLDRGTRAVSAREVGVGRKQ